MKKIVFALIGLLITIPFFAQDELSEKATVEKVLNIPVFIYSYPTVEFDEVTTLSATMSALSDALSNNSEQISVTDKVKEIINKAKRKVKKGDIEDFDAIIINPDDYSGIVIKFKDEISLQSDVKRISNVPIYMFSYPNDKFEEVDEFSATLSILGGGSLSDRTNEIVRKAKRREKKGKVKPFDAIIISPDDFKGILIKFN
ncbi:hypothetical protein [Saccharicrinis sp. FJH54]|uniref:hypothetical protein n=1 Tax=Saccharicrinis sp. FJH54 TaxID=3344665 RepID=UPI0035D4850F